MSDRKNPRRPNERRRNLKRRPLRAPHPRPIVDFEVEPASRLSSVVVLRAISAAARRWVRLHLVVEPWQRHGAEVSIERRAAPDILDGMLADGLVGGAL
jgi:hypothetical protein